MKAKATTTQGVVFRAQDDDLYQFSMERAKERRQSFSAYVRGLIHEDLARWQGELVAKGGSNQVTEETLARIQARLEEMEAFTRKPRREK